MAHKPSDALVGAGYEEVSMDGMEGPNDFQNIQCIENTPWHYDRTNTSQMMLPYNALRIYTKGMWLPHTGQFFVQTCTESRANFASADPFLDTI